MNIAEWMGEGINDTLLFPSPVSCSTEWGQLYLHHRVDLGQLCPTVMHTKAPHTVSAPETQAHVGRLGCWLARTMLSTSFKQGVGRKQYWLQIPGWDHPDLSCRQMAGFLSLSKLLPQTLPALFLHCPPSPPTLPPPQPTSLNVGPKEGEITVSSFEMTKFSSPWGPKTDLGSFRTSGLSYLRQARHSKHHPHVSLLGGKISGHQGKGSTISEQDDFIKQNLTNNRSLFVIKTLNTPGVAPKAPIINFC